MSLEELRAEVEKIEAQRAKRRAYSKLHRKAMTPELKARLSEYNKQRRVHQREVLERAAETGVAAAARIAQAVKPQTTAAKATAKPKPAKARRTA
jgi:hypothetical protein